MIATLGIAPAGYPLVGLLALAGVLLFALASWRGWWPLWVTAYLVVLVALLVAFFFRDPERVGDRGAGLFLSPADGRVLAVERVEEPHYLGGPALRVSIFLSLVDVHVQRSPVTGVVEYVEHRPGRFAAAWSDRADRENEHTIIGIRAGDERVVVRQVAGAVARRIVTYAREGDRIGQGDRIGLIRFGSRVEAYLPPDADVRVRAGDRVTAGTTVLALAPGEAGAASAAGERSAAGSAAAARAPGDGRTGGAP